MEKKKKKKIKKNFFFLNGPAFTPPPFLVAQPLVNELFFFAASLIDSTKKIFLHDRLKTCWVYFVYFKKAHAIRFCVEAHLKDTVYLLSNVSLYS